MSNWSKSGPALKSLVVLALVAVGCGGAPSSVESARLKGVDETASRADAITACVTAGSSLQTTADLNLRSGPSTDNSILLTMPNGSIAKEAGGGCPTSGWYKVTYSGTTGWASGSYLVVASTSSPSRDAAISRAATAVGFSYWWGHGAWSSGAAKGSCSGNCPSCTHSGSYGADCSGYAAKVWVVPSTNSNTATDSHPYSTVSFSSDTSQWTTISRDVLLKADALVYNTDGEGHIFIYDSGDGWGSMQAYECKGCAYGCVYNSRTADSSYHAIRHY